MTSPGEILLRVGAEGGSLTLSRVAGGFAVRLSEMDHGVDDLGALDEVIGEADSLPEALELMDRFPWASLALIELAPDVERAVLAGVEDRGGLEARERWCRRLAVLRVREGARPNGTASKAGLMEKTLEQHFRHSSYREKLIEHLFIGELLKISWLRGECSLEVAKPEVDSRGYDVIIERNGIVRHIQLKTSHRLAKAAGQKVHVGLAAKPSGCVVWIRFDEATLALGPFLFFGGNPGEPLPSIHDFKTGKHTKADAGGVKGDRPDIRVVPKSSFRPLVAIGDVFNALFVAG